jgi:Cof subfamily protein (haloacid dehalogenase superfamily)
MTTTSSVATTPGDVPKTVTPLPMQKFRMVALDLDGTLLTSQHCLSEATKKYLRYLDQQGFVIIFATGRAIPTVYDTIASLNLPKPIPVVCSNGAEGLLCSVEADGKTIQKESLFYTPVPESVAKRTIDLSRELGFVSQYYVGEDIYADPREAIHHELVDRYRELTGSKTICVEDNFEQAMKQGLPSKQLVLCRNEQQDDMMEAFENELAKSEYLIDGKRTHIVRGNLGWFLEILHPDVCKGHGLKKMCEYLKIPIEECISFGDGDNDYEFLQFSGRSYVMKNGRDVVKKIADEVLEYTNDEDGVVKTLLKLESEGCLVF